MTNFTLYLILMQLFYTQQIEGNRAVLGEVEAKHCTKVLRKRVGDSIQFIDGKGGWYKGTITDISKKDCWIEIESKTELEKWNGHIHIAIAPTKNISRMEWFLEKCTEIGIDEVSFIQCKHSERKQIRIDRLEKIVLSATKQSLKAHLPKVNELIPYKEFIGGVKDYSGQKLLCWVSEQNLYMTHYLDSDENIIILIGPEGDFSSDEIALALQAGFNPVSLGKSRLRTETAGVVACHLVHVNRESSK